MKPLDLDVKFGVEVRNERTAHCVWNTVLFVSEQLQTGAGVNLWGYIRRINFLV
jgi:hypothetical protein